MLNGLLWALLVGGLAYLVGYTRGLTSSSKMWRGVIDEHLEHRKRLRQ